MKETLPEHARRENVEPIKGKPESRVSPWSTSAFILKE